MNIDDAISELEEASYNVRFARLVTLCETHFGKARVKGSHHIFKTPWRGEPRLNLQKGEGGKAKAYQVDDVLDALRKLKDGG